MKTVLEPLIAPDAVLCGDGAGVYVGYGGGRGITRKVVRNRAGGERVVGAYHINTERVPQAIEGVDGAVHGVATTYLRNYLGWRRMLERCQAGMTISRCLHEHWGAIQHIGT